MTARFPHRYRVELASQHGDSGVITSPGRPEIVGGAPAEFGGRDDWWSPEQLLVASVVLCTMSTFHAFAEKEKLAVDGCRCHAEGTVDKTSAGLAFTAIHLRVELGVPPADVSRAMAILDRAKRHCLVASSLTCPVTVDSDITVA